MKKKRFLFALTAAAALLCGAQKAQAADDITAIYVNSTETEVVGIVDVNYTMEAGLSYSPGDVEVEYGLSSVLSYFDLSSYSSSMVLYGVNVTTLEAVSDYSSNYDGWHDAKGDFANWGYENVDGYVCVKIDNPSSGYIDYIGCIDESYQDGDTYTALYAFVYNNQAVVIRVNLTFGTVDHGSPSKMTSVGEETVIANLTTTGSWDDTDPYESVTVSLDVSSIASALGCSVGDYTVMFLKSEDSFAAAGTANMGGSWFNADGWIGTWGDDGYVYVDCEEELDFSTLDVGEYPELTSDGDVYYCPMYFVYDEKYYLVTVKVIIGDYTPLETMEGVYLINVAEDKFLSRGADYGTEADLDNYGIPLNLILGDDGETFTVQFIDSQLYLYGPNWAWTDGDPDYTETDADGNITYPRTPNAFTLTEVEDEGSSYGTIYQLSCDAGLLYVNTSMADGLLRVALNGVKNDNYTDDDQTYWVILSKEERDAIKDAWVQQQKENVAASLNLSADDLDTYTEGTDCTSSVVDNALAGSFSGWTDSSAGTDEQGNTTSSFASNENGTELFQGAATLTQTVTDLAPGAYKVTLQGFLRQSTNSHCYELGDSEYDLSIAYLKANDYEINLKPWYVEGSYDENKEGAKADDPESYYTPNSMSEASNICDTEGNDYGNTLYTVVGEDGELTITIGCPGVDTAGWMFFKTLTLTQLGKYDVIANENPEEPGVYYCTYSDAETDRTVPTGVTAYILEATGVDPQGDE
ncbi:MAG: DUF4859 domain-containing protein, partial [Prevotellaceae bacterium]|nr:DUF4859 domain-containing protein [Prevotellaceae bacterium]